MQNGLQFGHNSTLEFLTKNYWVWSRGVRSGVFKSDTMEYIARHPLASYRLRECAKTNLILFNTGVELEYSNIIRM